MVFFWANTTPLGFFVKQHHGEGCQQTIRIFMLGAWSKKSGRSLYRRWMGSDESDEQKKVVRPVAYGKQHFQFLWQILGLSGEAAT